jgi:hypothetical protein
MTGAVNVRFVAAAAVSFQLGQVISMTGVHPTVPVGTHQVDGFHTSPWSVDCADAAADDLVVDNLTYVTVTPPAAAGANQTIRNSQNHSANTVWIAGSTQPGADAGVMSWSVAGSVDGYLGAVAFKPATGAGIAIPVLTRQYRERWN